mgnify:CR=1 FL=1
MAENREIIYLAICNQIQIYHLLLEDSSIDKDNREMMSYILEESLKIEENMRKELQKETPIGRPKWTQK